ncbi:MAG: (2Fe-2S)-binding protein [Actinomycetota bacterium]|nr:(2Fe-2S)-binding protein [Actinomycetota bacterium]
MTDAVTTDDPALTDPAPGGSRHLVSLEVNGVAHTVEVPARRLLSDTLRHDLRLTGTHVGCEHGVCGACTVLIDGTPARSCLTFAVMVDGASITTVEGLARADGTLHPVQQAFSECHGLQCGYCTPGFLVLTKALLDETPDPSDDEVADAISGNLCRCTGYQNIKASVRRAAELYATAEPADEASEDAPSDGKEPT